MRAAIAEAQSNLRPGRMRGGPFGACLVQGRGARARVIATAHNTVLVHDATAHAEINCIRKASRVLGTFDLHGCVIYSTTEPCPMCFAAIHWARIDAVVYGTAVRDAAAAGFNELRVTNAWLKKKGGSRVALYPGFMRRECGELFAQWRVHPSARTY